MAGPRRSYGARHTYDVNYDPDGPVGICREDVAKRQKEQANELRRVRDELQRLQHELDVARRTSATAITLLTRVSKPR
jgi:hypothetical protein